MRLFRTVAVGTLVFASLLASLDVAFAQKDGEIAEVAATPATAKASPKKTSPPAKSEASPKKTSLPAKSKASPQKTSLPDNAKATPKRTSPPTKTKPRKASPPRNPKDANKLQYTKGVLRHDLDEDYVIEVGFLNPSGLRKGDTVIFNGRTAARASEEGADFLNRSAGHKVLFAEDYDDNADGNGGRVWIAANADAYKGLSRSGGKNNHTADGCYGMKK